MVDLDEESMYKLVFLFEHISEREVAEKSGVVHEILQKEMDR